MAVLCEMPTTQYSSRSTRLNYAHAERMSQRLMQTFKTTAVNTQYSDASKHNYKRKIHFFWIIHGTAHSQMHP